MITTMTTTVATHPEQAAFLEAEFIRRRGFEVVFGGGFHRGRSSVSSKQHISSSLQYAAYRCRLGSCTETGYRRRNTMRRKFTEGRPDIRNERYYSVVARPAALSEATGGQAGGRSAK